MHRKSFGCIETQERVMSQSTNPIIAEHNDRFRHGDGTLPGSVVVTAGIRALLVETSRPAEELLGIVQTFDAFTADNDPYAEHDFGAFDFAGQRCFWKIDLYSNDLTAYTPDPTDPAKTHRVLTIMLAHEY